jgi:hypothetical protein
VTAAHNERGCHERGPAVDVIAEVDRRVAERRHAETAWLCAYEQARDAGVDLGAWLDAHPYPTGDPQHVRRLFSPEPK